MSPLKMFFKTLFTFYVCLLFNFVYCQKYSNFLNVDEHGDNIFEKCMTNIIRNNIHCGSVITAVTERNINSLLEAISHDECYSIITRTLYSQEWFVWNEQVVLLMNDIFEFGSQNIDLTNDLLWNKNAKYIIHIPNVQGGKDFAKVLLKHNIFNVVFVVSRKRGNRIYTYYPFKYGNCAGDQDTLVSLGICKDNVSIFHIFQNKMPEKFDKCTIKVARNYEIPYVILESRNYTLRGKRLHGLEEYILESIGAKKGYRIDYIETDNDKEHGVVLHNYTVTGVLKYLETEEADISIGGYVLNLNRAKVFDYIWGHHFGGLNIITARKPINRWNLVYKEFSWLTWIIIGAYFCLFVLVFNIYNATGRFIKDRVLLILKLWGYFYVTISNTLFKNKKIRGILMCWIWFTFFISNFYITAFYSLITENNRRIYHGHKLDKSIYKPCISLAMRTFMKYTYNITWSDNVLTMCNKKKKSLEIVASRNDLFSIEMKYTYAIMEQKYIDDEGNNLLEVREFGKTATVTAMFTARGYPLRETIQTATRNMAETGLLQAHLETIHLKILKTTYAEQKTFKNLDMDSIGVAWALLFCGLLIALIAFILEVVYNKSCSVTGN